MALYYFCFQFVNTKEVVGSSTFMVNTVLAVKRLEILKSQRNLQKKLIIYRGASQQQQQQRKAKSNSNALCAVNIIIIISSILHTKNSFLLTNKKNIHLCS